MIRHFINLNIRYSQAFDAYFFPSLTPDGNHNFLKMLKYRIGTDLQLVDIGGGKTPLFTPDEVRAKRLKVTGVDISADELASAPVGAYETKIVADITVHRSESKADVVVVQSLLEHVSDGNLAAQGIASFCRPGGMIYTFCPNRRAWFARINRLLPERIKRLILYFIYPEAADIQGFPAHYDRCTPTELSASFLAAGVHIETAQPYFVSSYFMFFFPLYFVWRIFNWPFMKLWPLQFCETFVLIGTMSAASARSGT